jgi:hypothetical protein
VFFVSVLNPLCDDKHVKAHTSGFKLKQKKYVRAGLTSAVLTETAVPLPAKYTMEYCAFQLPSWGSGGGRHGVWLVTVEIAHQHIKERFNTRIPLVTCLLYIERGLIAKFKASRSVKSVDTSLYRRKRL